MNRMAESPLRVVVAEDSFLLRAGVVRVLEDAGFAVVGEARDAEELLEQVREHRPDVAVTDIRMPPTNTDEGVRAATLIRAEFPETGVLVLSQYVKESYALRLLGDSAAGVGYLLKQRVMEPASFVDAVRQVSSGGSALDPEVVAQMLERRAPGGPGRPAHSERAGRTRRHGGGTLQPGDRPGSGHQRGRSTAPHHQHLRQARPAARR